MLDDKEKKYLLSLARRSVRYYLENKKTLELEPGEVVSKKLTEDGACFVSIHLNGELRGCIGSLEAHRPLMQDVIENALSCAFEDPRFYPVDLPELEKVKFSISVLSEPKPLKVKDDKDLLKKLKPNKHGLIIRKGVARATFLPVVWEQIPEKEEFLAHLSRKAGLAPQEWRDTKSMEFFIYEAEEFSE